MVWGIALGAVIVGIAVVVVLGASLLRPSDDPRATGAQAGPGPAGQLATGTSQPGSGQPGSTADGQDAGAAGATAPSDTFQIEEVPPDRIIPGRPGPRAIPKTKGTATAAAAATGHPTAPPPPPPGTGDPFSERL